MRLPLTLLAAFLAASFIASRCRDTLPPGPKNGGSSDTIALYRFNGDAADLTGNGHTGTLHSIAFTDDRFGHPNSALLLNGTSSYVSVANKTDISFTADQSFTL